MKKLLLSAALAFLGTFGAQAQLIWNNDITDANPSSANPFTAGQVVDPELTVSGISRGSGATANAGSNRYNAASWNTPTLDPTAYFSFTLTPTASHEIDFTSFSYTGQASGSFTAAQFAFRSSLDGFASDIGTPSTLGTSIDLSGAAYQNLTSPIEFRFYVWGGPTATATYSINDFAFNGVVSAIPEPSTYALIGMGLGSLLVLRRMKRSSKA